MPVTTRQQSRRSGHPPILRGGVKSAKRWGRGRGKGPTAGNPIAGFGGAGALVNAVIDLVSKDTTRCLYEIFATGWSQCRTGVYQPPWTGATVGTRIVANGITQAPANFDGAVIMDKYTPAAGGGPGTIIFQQTDPIVPGNVCGNPAWPHELGHGLYTWPAALASMDRYTFNLCVSHIGCHATQVLEKETFLVGPVPAAGAPDTRHCGFRGWMLSPIREDVFPDETVDPRTVATACPFPRYDGVIRNNMARNGGHRGLEPSFPTRANMTAAQLAGIRAAPGDQLGRTSEQLAADGIKSISQRRGGPSGLILGPEIIERTYVCEPSMQWQNRVAAEGQGPTRMTTINWTRQTQLKTLCIDFYDFRRKYVNEQVSLGRPSNVAIGEADVFIQNTAAHIQASWTGPAPIPAPAGVPVYPRLDLLVISGLRSELTRPTPVRANPAGRAVLPLNGNNPAAVAPPPLAPIPPMIGVPPGMAAPADPNFIRLFQKRAHFTAPLAIANIEGPAVCPATGRPNWFQVWSPLLAPGGSLVLIDCDEDAGVMRHGIVFVDSELVSSFSDAAGAG